MKNKIIDSFFRSDKREATRELLMSSGI